MYSFLSHKKGDFHTSTCQDVFSSRRYKVHVLLSIDAMEAGEGGLCGIIRIHSNAALRETLKQRLSRLLVSLLGDCVVYSKEEPAQGVISGGSTTYVIKGISSRRRHKRLRCPKHFSAVTKCKLRRFLLI